MRVIIRSSYSQNNRNIFELTTENHAEYCKRHGYTYLPVDEPYTPYVDTNNIIKYLEEYDIVVTVGVDVLIKHMDQTLEELAEPGITICPEIKSGTLNADLVLYTKEAIPLLRQIATLQKNMPDGQTAINHLRLRNSLIHINNRLQLAAPSMNPGLDYSAVCIIDYFALHYHTIGKIPVVADKAAGIRKDLVEEHK